MHIGVDFGTTYTKIAFFDPQGDRLEQFVYPPPPGEKPYVPTAVAYRTEQGQLTITIGEAARHDALNIPDTVFCENFKMLLPLKTREEWQRHGWTAPHTPYEVTHNYFRRLLRESEGSFERRHGPITRMVVSVPELWQRHTNVGAETLRRILVDDLRLPVDHLQSEPVCAAAYYIWHTKPDLTRPLHLLVCDMGGGTFDMVLCRVQRSAHGYKIQVLDFDGLGQSGVGSAGVAFDRQVVTKAYQNQGCTPDPHDPEFIEVVREFEEAKLQRHGEAKRLFDLCRTSPDHARDLVDTPLYLYQWKRKYAVTIEQVRECFEPIRAGIIRVLDKLLARAQARQWPVERVALVGGFSRFPLVEQTILDHPGLQAGSGQRDSSLTLNSDERFYAIARGAALIAHDYIQIEEYYPHTLELLVHRTRPTLHMIALPIVEAGQMLAGRLQPYYAQQDGHEVTIHVQRDASGRLPVQLRLMGQGKPLTLKTPETEFPPPGHYRVGVLIDRSNLGTLVFDSVEHDTRYRYPLGNISPSLPIEEA